MNIITNLFNISNLFNKLKSFCLNKLFYLFIQLNIYNNNYDNINYNKPSKEDLKQILYITHKYIKYGINDKLSIYYLIRSISIFCMYNIFITYIYDYLQMYSYIYNILYIIHCIISGTLLVSLFKISDECNRNAFANNIMLNNIIKYILNSFVLVIYINNKIKCKYNTLLCDNKIYFCNFIFIILFLKTIININIYNILFYYIYPLISLNIHIYIIRFLQHTHININNNNNNNKNYLSEAFKIIDRQPNYYIDNLYLHICSTHLINHINPRIPHYHAIKACEEIKKNVSNIYIIDKNPIIFSLMKALYNYYYHYNYDKINNENYNKINDQEKDKLNNENNNEVNNNENNNENNKINNIGNNNNKNEMNKMFGNIDTKQLNEMNKMFGNIDTKQLNEMNKMFGNIDPAQLNEMNKMFGNIDPTQLNEMNKMFGHIDPKQLDKMNKMFDHIDPKQLNEMNKMFGHIDPKQLNEMNKMFGHINT